MNFDVTIEIPKGQRNKNGRDDKILSEALAEIDDCRKRLADSEGGHP